MLHLIEATRFHLNGELTEHDLWLKQKFERVYKVDESPDKPKLFQTRKWVALQHTMKSLHYLTGLMSDPGKAVPGLDFHEPIFF